MKHLETCLLIVEAERLLCHLVMFLNAFLHWMNKMKYSENTPWKVLAYGIYARVVDVSEIERVSAANE